MSHSITNHTSTIQILREKAGDGTSDCRVEVWQSDLALLLGIAEGCYEECTGDDGCPGDWPPCHRRLIPSPERRSIPSRER